MEGFELIQNAKNVDFTGLGEWIDAHSKRIECFAFQYGLSLDHALEITLDTFSTFRKELESYDEPKQLVCALYKISIDKITHVYSTIQVPDDIFAFNEDMELHTKIIELNEKYRIPFVLSVFHDLNSEEIAAITGELMIEVEDRIRIAKELLGEDSLGKHIELLGKSYDRLPLQFKASQIIGTGSKTEKPKSFRKKSVLRAVIGVLVLSVSIIAIIILPNKDKQADSADSYFVELKERYKEERDRQQEVLKLTDERFNDINFIREADDRVNELKIADDLMERKDLEVEFEKIINDLKPPSEMIFDLIETTLADDEAASIAYLSRLQDKVNDMIAIYNGIIWDYRETIEDFEAGTQKAATMMLSHTEFPEEFQNMIDTMRDHSIKLCTTKNAGEIKSCYHNSTHSYQIQHYTHHNTAGYVNMMAYEYYLNYMNLEYSLDWIANELQVIQNTVLQGQQDVKMYPILESYYISFFHDIIKGTEFTEGFEALGRVPDDYLEVWNRFYTSEDVTPIAYLIFPIVEEMEQSDWRGSDRWEQFNRDKIIEALKLARSGELEHVMYGDVPVVHDDLVEFPNALFSSDVTRLYNEFIKSYDNTIFKDLSPNYVVGVFDYANEMEDPETMFNLIDKDTAEYLESPHSGSLEKYIEQWQKGFSLFKGATKIEFKAHDLVRDRRNYYSSIIITDDDHNEWNFVLSLGKNRIWYVRDIRHISLPSSQNFTEELIPEVFQDQLPYLYDYVASSEEFILSHEASAIEIVGLYFYAGALGDFETQYSLYYQGPGSNVIEKEQYVKESMAKGPQLEIEDLFKTISFKGMEQDTNGNWPGVATLTVNDEKNPGEEAKKSFKVIWTEHGWRVVYNPME